MALPARSFSDSFSSLNVDWEEVSCPLCAEDDYSPLIEAPDAEQDDGLRFLVVQCRRCMLCFTNPRPSPLSIGRFYGAQYRPHQRKEQTRGEKASFWRRLFSAKPDQDMRHCIAPHGQKRLLDFGCGETSFLLRMQSLGWQVTGMDVTRAVVENLRAEGLPALHGTLPHPAVEPESFDMVTMWGSLEHVHQPLETLRAAADALAPGGKILVSVPNIESMPYRWFGASWFALDLPRHLTHFSPSTLRRMMERAGFRAGSVCMSRGSSWIRRSANLARHMGIERTRKQRWMASRLGSNLASWYAYLRGMSDRMMVLGVKD